MIVNNDCPQCGNSERLQDGLCPTCVLQQALGLFAYADAASACDSTVSNECTVNRLTEFLAPPEATDEIGRLGSYRILAVLGHGGMGVVYRAEDPGLKRMVAVKAMLPNLVARGEDRNRFLREARTAAAVRDDHVVNIFQVGEEGGIPFVAMELLEGESLDARMRRMPRLTVTEILRIGRETALGLAAAHAKGVIHRDIKPGNLWLETKDGRVKILDFGLARLKSEDSHVTQPGVIIGTPAYMAPEQARGAEPDPRCDLFSLGCVLYRLCTGSTPFRGKDSLAVVASLALDTPAPPRQCNPEVPASLSDFILHMLEKDPVARPSSALDVADALSRISSSPGWIPALRTPADLESMPVEGDAETRSLAHLSLGGSAEGPPRRNKNWLLALALAAVVTTLIAIVFFLQTRDGVIRVEVRDPQILVKLGNGDLIVQGKGEKEVSITPGDNWLHIERDGFTFKTNRFALHRGDRLRFLVEWVEGKIVVSKDGAGFQESGRPDHPLVVAPGKTTPPSLDPDRAAAEWVLGIKGQVNGVGNGEFRSLADLPKTLFRIGLIDLGSKPVSDDDLKRFAKLGELHHLDLTSTQVTDDGLCHLQNLSKLELLRLDGNKITDKGLPYLKGFAHLRRLFLAGTSITDNGLPHLKDLNLLVLGLVNSRIGDAGVAHIARMPTIDTVALNGTRITDEALLVLADMTNLKRLFIDDTKVSANALIAFRKARPDVEVTSNAIEGKSVTYPPMRSAALDAKEVGANVEGWLDLLPRIDLKNDVLEGSFAREGPGLVNTGSYFNRLRLPVRIKGAYEIRADFVVDSENPPNLHSWSFPAGDIRLGLWVMQVTSIGKVFKGFARLDPVYGDDPGTIKPMRKHSLLVRIEPAPARSRVLAEMDGKTFSHWQGNLTSDHDQFDHDYFKGGSREELVLHVRKGRLRFVTLQIRTLSGTLESLRR